MDLRLRTATGAYAWVRHHGLPCFDAQQQFTGYVGSSFDITDLKQGRDELTAETKRLAEAKRDLEDLAQNAAHDSPGAAAQPGSDGAPSRGCVAYPRPKRCARPAWRSSAAYVHSFADIADFAQGGRGELSLAVCDPAEPLEWAISNLRERIDASEAVIEVRGARRRAPRAPHGAGGWAPAPRRRRRCRGSA